MQSSIPDGLVGEGPSGSVPHHGIVINLSADGKDSIWIDASYNVFYYKDSTMAADGELVNLKMEGATYVKVTGLSPLPLCKLKALRQTVSYKDQSGRATMQETVSAVRFYGDEPGIVYTIGLRTSPETFAGNRKWLDLIVASFKCSFPTG